MSRQALELALEALTYIYTETTADEDELIDKAITAIKKALAQPEQEPVATVESVATVVSESGNQEVTMSWWHEPALPVGIKLYTAPPQGIYYTPPRRTWVGLTPDDFRQLEKETTVNGYNGDYCPTWDLIEAVEEKLKEKNT